jgi:hypothetical protein
VDRVRDQRGGDQRRPSARQADDPEQERAERGEPDEAQLGGRLEVELVRVVHRFGDRAVLEPLHAE